MVKVVKTLLVHLDEENCVAEIETLLWALRRGLTTFGSVVKTVWQVYLDEEYCVAEIEAAGLYGVVNTNPAIPEVVYARIQLDKEVRPVFSPVLDQRLTSGPGDSRGGLQLDKEVRPFLLSGV